MNNDTITWRKIGEGELTCWVADYKGHQAIVQPAEYGPMGSGYEAFVDKKSLGFSGGGTVHGRQYRSRNNAEQRLLELVQLDQELEAAQGQTRQ